MSKVVETNVHLNTIELLNFSKKKNSLKNTIDEMIKSFSTFCDMIERKYSFCNLIFLTEFCQIFCLSVTESKFKLTLFIIYYLPQ